MLTYDIKKNGKPIYENLYESIKRDILLNNVKANEKLPSKRHLAEQLNISVITVENAYNQLMLEGYIYAIEKKGYFVEELNDNYKIIKNKKIIDDKEIKEDNKQSTPVKFPYYTWAKITRKVLSENDEFVTPSFAGDIDLRKAICKHLRDFHNMNVSYKNIIIGAGSEYLYSLLVQYFSLDKIYALENPGHLAIGKTYKNLNAKYKYIDLDSEGIIIKDLIKSKANVLHISPAHHFPTGITTPLKRRLDLLKWANDTGSYIIEDDYDSEFRISGNPIPPLYELDNNDRVIYMNTFSNTLSSSFRIAYLVLPDKLIKPFLDKLGFYHSTISTLDQKILAQFIADGYFERHISRSRKIYREIYKELINEIKPLLKKYDLKLIEEKSGLHFLIEHNFNISDKKLEELIRKNNINFYCLSHYYNIYKDTKQILINYSKLNSDEINRIIDNLDKVFKEISKHKKRTA